jgi:hypothetical protein
MPQAGVIRMKLYLMEIDIGAPILWWLARHPVSGALIVDASFVQFGGVIHA